MEGEIKKVSEACVVYYNSGQFEKAEAECTELLEKYESDKNNSQLAVIFNNRGHARYMQVEFYTAKDDFDEAIKRDPMLASAYYNKATILYRMGDYIEALKDFKKSIDLEPDNEEFREGLESCQACVA